MSRCDRLTINIYLRSTLANKKILKNKIMYTDDTLLTFGKHRFTKLCRVPADYLYSVYKNKSYQNNELKEYIINNLENIILRMEGILQPPPLDFPCEKISYSKEKDAKQVLQKITVLEQIHKKPIRVYECEKCGQWHLTSLSIEEWEIKIKKA